MKEALELLVRAGDAYAASQVEELLRTFDEQMLSDGSYPYECFCVICAVLSHKTMTKSDDFSPIVSSLMIDGHRMDEAQRSEIKTIILENYKEYRSEEICLSVTHFIAKEYQVDIAIDVLRELYNTSSAEGKTGALCGFDVLYRRAGPKDKERIYEIVR